MLANTEHAKGRSFSKIFGRHKKFRRKGHFTDKFEPVKRVILLIFIVLIIVVVGTTIGLF